MYTAANGRFMAVAVMDNDPYRAHKPSSDPTPLDRTLAAVNAGHRTRAILRDGHLHGERQRSMTLTMAIRASKLEGFRV
jgi:hypothetical protein